MTSETNLMSASIAVPALFALVRTVNIMVKRFTGANRKFFLEQYHMFLCGCCRVRKMSSQLVV